MSDQTKQSNSNNPPPASQAQPQELESGVGGVAQTRNSNSLLRNIVYVLSLIGLVSLLFWLITPPNQTILTAQAVTPTPAGGWEIPVPPNTITPTTTATAETTTVPTETPFIRPTLDTPPTSHITPIATILLPGGGSYGIFDSLIITNATYTPGPPTPTPTSTPVPALRAISDEPLLSPEILAQMGEKGTEYLWAVAWPTEDNLILASGYDSSKATYWSISLKDKIAQQIEYSRTYEIETIAMNELRQYDERIERALEVNVSPDKKWAAWGLGETLLIKQIGANQPPINLLGKVEFEQFRRGSRRLVWSPQSDKLAYVIKHSYFQIRISDPLGQQTHIIKLDESPPAHLAWSANGQYLAFNMLKVPQSGIENLYVVKADGTNLGELLGHGLVQGNIVWSPTGQAIIYNRPPDQPWIVQVASN